MKEYRLKLKNLDCPECAEKLERKISAEDSVHTCRVDYIHALCVYSCEEEDHEKTEQIIRSVIRSEEPDTVVITDGSQEQKEEEGEGKNRLFFLTAGAALTAIGLFLSGTWEAVILIAAYLILGWSVIYKAVRNLLHGRVFDENFLMTLATVSAILLKDYREAAAVMLFYQVGEYFEDRAVEKSRASISSLMDIRPDSAAVYRNGIYVTVEPQDVHAGETIRIRPGERVPLDGIILEGSTSLNTSSLTGESRPRDVSVGDEVISGCVNQSGLIQVKVSREYGESTVSRILNLVENAESRKAKTETFITKFSRIYTPAVVISAALLAVILLLNGGSVYEAVTRACTFLVISCPCALVISIPLSFFAGIGGLSSMHILVKGSNVIETLAQADQIVFDKTGTLTSGTFAVEKIIGSERTLADAAYAEHSSSHPLAQGILAAYHDTVDETRIRDVRELPGRGVSMSLDGRKILAGNWKLMQENGIACAQVQEPGSMVYVASEGVFEGYLVLKDQLKTDAASCIQGLQKDHRKCILVSGDSHQITENTAGQLKMDAFYSECMPDQKVEVIQKLKKSGTTLFVGDGVNDAPVLVSADAGVAMGALGSDAAIEAADAVIMDDAPSRMLDVIAGSRKILRTARENIWFAIAVKLLILVLAAVGLANMWMAVFADVGVALLCILNSMKLLHMKSVVPDTI